MPEKIVHINGRRLLNGKAASNKSKYSHMYLYWPWMYLMDIYNTSKHFVC